MLTRRDTQKKKEIKLRVSVAGNSVAKAVSKWQRAAKEKKYQIKSLKKKTDVLGKQHVRGKHYRKTKRKT